MNNRLLIFLSLLALMLLGCRQKTIDLGENISFRAEQNISYGKDNAQKMDLYIPEKNRDIKKVFIMIHGGGWRGGRKSQLTRFIFDLMKKFPDQVFINLDYRLASTTRFAIPNQTDDIKMAMLCIEKKLKMEPKYILLGNSAGGHLSMLYAYRYNQEKKVKAVLNIVGPADLNDPDFKHYEDYAFVKRHLTDPETAGNKLSPMDSGSPVYWINSTSAPTLSYYGMNDHVVPISQKRMLDSALTRHHVYHESYEYNGDHTGWEDTSQKAFLLEKIE